MQPEAPRDTGWRRRWQESGRKRGWKYVEESQRQVKESDYDVMRRSG